MFYSGKFSSGSDISLTNSIFRSVALFYGSWGIRSNWLGDWHERVGPISKVFAIIFPSIIVGLSHANAVLQNTGLFFVVTNITSTFIITETKQ